MCVDIPPFLKVVMRSVKKLYLVLERNESQLNDIDRLAHWLAHSPLWYNQINEINL